MNRFTSWILSLIVFMVMVSLLSCEKSTSPTEDQIDPNAANAKVQEAYTEMENQMYFIATYSFKNTSDLDKIDFSRANTLFKDAIKADPSNSTAHFGAALTEIFMVYSDSAINNAIKRWEGASLGKKQTSPFFQFGIPSNTKDMTVPVQLAAKNLAKIIRTAVIDPPLIGEMQNIMRDRLLPRINYALERFGVVEQNNNFELKVSGKMQGNTNLQPVYLDLTEVYVMDGILLGMKALVEQFLVYRFDLASYTSKALVEALQPDNTTFFYLASDGTTRSRSVKTDLIGMIGKFRSAINFLKSETDDQSDDIIKIAHSGSSGIPVADLDTTLSYLTQVENAFSTPQTVTLNNADSDGNNYTIQVNIGSFFENPPQNPKRQWLPAYTIDTSSQGNILWRWQAQDYASFTFPDPTFSGLFPGMTDNILKRILYIDEAFAWRVNVYLSDNIGIPPTSITAKLIINGTTYFPKNNPNYYYYWSNPLGGWGYSLTFYVQDNANQQAQLVAIIDGSEVPLELSQPAVVKLKSYFFISANLTLAPQNITGNLLFNGSQYYVYLDLINYQYYKIERDNGSGTFSVIDSIYANYYYDWAVTNGKIYRYRACMGPYSSWYSSDYAYAFRPNNYTNTVSITIP